MTASTGEPADVVRRVAIIGSGPAGYTAALYAARADLEPVLFEGSLEAGGALMRTSDVENYPGFPDGVLGPELMAKLREQAIRFGTEVITDDVTAVELAGDVKLVHYAGGTYRAQTVILATGSSYRELGLEAERRLGGRGVSYCATCDGFFFKEQDIVVVGGGDSALEEATFLTRFARSVTIVHRREELRASSILQRRALDDPKITFAWNSAVADILGDEEVEGVVLRDTRDGSERTLDVTGVFIAIGHEPRSELVRGQLELGPNGHILVDPPTSRTSFDGVFACGDVVDWSYMQAVTAAGSGCVAALDAQRWLQEHATPEPARRSIPATPLSTSCRV
jgi:thioredoxin reductase (NADPH)